MLSIEEVIHGVVLIWPAQLKTKTGAVWATVTTHQFTTPFPSLRETHVQHLCLYAETPSSGRTANITQTIPYANEIRLASFNTRSLLKPAMQTGIIQHMRQHSLHVLCLQETKSKNTTQYVVDNYTFLTVSAADPNHQEHAVVGFVLSPTARRVLLRTHPVSNRLASITLLTVSGEISILNGYAPQSSRPEEERQEFFDL